MRLANGIISSSASVFIEEMRMQQRKKCFVIMPISKSKSCTACQWKSIFDAMIKPAITGSKLGFTCERSKPRTGNAIKDILTKLNRADVVIADLTDMNPNVFYELGVRHTLRNRTILIAQDMKYVPFDLRSYWVVIYKKDLSGVQDFKDRIRDIMKDMMNNPEQRDNPVGDFLGEKNISLLSQERSANLKKLTALVSECSYNLHSVDRILRLLDADKKGQSRKERGRFVSSYRVNNICLTELLSTRYIELPKEILERLVFLNGRLQRVNTILDLWSHEGFSHGGEILLVSTMRRLKNYMSVILNKIDRVRLDYMNNNYQEEVTPVLLLSSDQHKQYLEST
jgi:hypothetical protein